MLEEKHLSNAGSTLEHTDSDGEEELDYCQGWENSLSFSEQQKCWLEEMRWDYIRWEKTGTGEKILIWITEN